MATLPYMQFYVGDYLADTSHLTTLEHGAYLLLLFAYWRKGGPLPNDDKRLAIIAKVSAAEWDEMSVTMKEFFTEDGDMLVHERIEKDLVKAKSKQDRAAIARENRWPEISKTPKSDTKQSNNDKKTETKHNNIRYQNSDIRIQNQNSELESKPKLEDKEGGILPLANKIRDMFYDMQTDRTTFDFKREVPHCKKLAEKALKHDDPEGFLKTLFSAYLDFKRTDLFYQNKPVLPSMINSSGVYAQLVESVEEKKRHQLTDEEKSWISGMFQGVNK